MKDEFKVEVNNDFINFTLKFKVDIYNYEFEGRKLNFPHAELSLIENTNFITNKFFLLDPIIKDLEADLIDGDSRKNKFNELKKNWSSLDLLEQYKIYLKILSLFFRMKKSFPPIILV